MTEDEFQGPWNTACELWAQWKPGEAVRGVWFDRLSSFTVDAVTEAFTAHYAERGEARTRYREPLLPAIIRKAMQISGRESASGRNLEKERLRWVLLTPRTRWRVQRGLIVDAMNRGNFDQSAKDKLADELRMVNHQISRCGPIDENECRMQMLFDREYWRAYPEEAPNPIPDLPTDCYKCGKETGGKTCPECFAFAGTTQPTKGKRR